MIEAIRYKNRRLYQRRGGSRGYITYPTLAAAWLKGAECTVFDMASGKDITLSALLMGLADLALKGARLRLPKREAFR